MKRYEFNQTKRTTKFNRRSKKVYGTIIYPKIERHVDDFYIDVIVEDRLDNLAYQYYEDVTLWWIIANANKLDRASNYGITQKQEKSIGKGSMFVEPGQRIRIPNPSRISQIVSDYEKMLEERTYDLVSLSTDDIVDDTEGTDTNTSGGGGGGY
jgi:hypothetical protein